MKYPRLFASLGAVCLAPALAYSQTTVFNEGFSGSTVASATPAAPTLASTDYAVLSSKNATGSSISSTLDLTIPGTSAGFAEMQALFTTSPVTLDVGEFVQLQMTFQPTLLLDNNDGTRTQTINVGLYNSGGVYPVPGGQMANGGMGGGTSFVTGSAQNWQGYVGRVGNLNGGNSSQIFTRDPQADTTDENQDVLFNNSGTGAFDNPTGTGVAGSGDQINLTDGQDYTLTLNISYDGSGVTVAQNIFEGVGTGGLNVYSLAGDHTAGYTTFDALGFGYRGSAGSTINMSLSALEITTGVVPEPSTFAFLGLGGLALLGFRRRG
jgi:hypothetical protein